MTVAVMVHSGVEEAVAAVATRCEAPAYWAVLHQVGAHLGAHVELHAGTRVVAVGRPGRRMVEGAAETWGPLDVIGVTVARDDHLEVGWTAGRPGVDVPVAVFVPVVRTALVLHVLLGDMGRNGQAPVTVLAAHASGRALRTLRRARPYLEVVTPELLGLTEPATTPKGWTRR